MDRILVFGLICMGASVHLFSRTTPLMDRCEEYVRNHEHQNLTDMAVADSRSSMSFLVSLGAHCIYVAVMFVLIRFLRWVAELDQSWQIITKASLNWSLALLSAYGGNALPNELYSVSFLVAFGLLTLTTFMYWEIEDDFGIVDAINGAALSTDVRIPERPFPFSICVAIVGVTTPIFQLQAGQLIDYHFSFGQ